MQKPIDKFDDNISRARDLVALAGRLTTLTANALDLSDLLRAALVFGVSALDHFIHEFVRLGMLEVHRGSRATTDAYLAFRIPLCHARSGLKNNIQDDWLEQAINESLGWQSFQQPNKIADAIRLVSAVDLWGEIAKELDSNSKLIKANLSVIVDRRNKIAHEADIDLTNPGHRWPINVLLVTDALDFLEKLAHTIHKLA